MSLNFRIVVTDPAIPPKQVFASTLDDARLAAKQLIESAVKAKKVEIYETSESLVERVEAQV